MGRWWRVGRNNRPLNTISNHHHHLHSHNINNWVYWLVINKCDIRITTSGRINNTQIYSLVAGARVDSIRGWVVVSIIHSSPHPNPQHHFQLITTPVISTILVSVPILIWLILVPGLIIFALINQHHHNHPITTTIPISLPLPTNSQHHMDPVITLHHPHLFLPHHYSPKTSITTTPTPTPISHHHPNLRNNSANPSPINNTPQTTSPNHSSRVIFHVHIPRVTIIQPHHHQRRP